MDLLQTESREWKHFFNQILNKWYKSPDLNSLAWVRCLHWCTECAVSFFCDTAEHSLLSSLDGRVFLFRISQFAVGFHPPLHWGVLLKHPSSTYQRLMICGPLWFQPGQNFLQWWPPAGTAHLWPNTHSNKCYIDLWHIKRWRFFFV